ncbi:hypothetical protein DK26_15010 [Bosea sp. WAO]|uniref:hypothetical protein n=1 Tax=Bosea sp. WAO TaxID=406341 RepID=UPI0007475486|nr:hypothetical protein [Bosea sp. WAO]KUL94321.1 hypothetical protein DK26_15010 [Bosea sp. WAO]
MSTVDTPAGMIARLDASLARRGEAVTVRRRVGPAPNVFVEVQCRAKVTGFNSEVLVAGVKQTASSIVMSPTQFQAAASAGTWPGAAGGGVWPKVGDFIRQADGRERKIEAGAPIVVGDVVVRIEAKVLG